jgi:hypothetical protein
MAFGTAGDFKAIGRVATGIGAFEQLKLQNINRVSLLQARYTSHNRDAFFNTGIVESKLAVESIPASRLCRRVVGGSGF